MSNVFLKKYEKIYIGFERTFFREVHKWGKVCYDKQMSRERAEKNMFEKSGDHHCAWIAGDEIVAVRRAHQENRQKDQS